MLTTSIYTKLTRNEIRLNLKDSNGIRYNFKLEGNVSKEKMMFKMFEFMKLVDIEEDEKEPNLDALGPKIFHIIEKHFPAGDFTSNGVLEKYEDEYNEPIKLSIISTYLKRFTEKGDLQRSKRGRECIYQTTISSQKQSGRR